MSDSRYSTERERSGKSHSRVAMCGNDECPEGYNEKIVWAIKQPSGLLGILTLFCPACHGEVMLGPWI